jgi:DNA polymerase-3 subunit epsilon
MHTIDPPALKHLQIRRPLVFLDLETTGLDPQEDRIVEWSILRYEPGHEHDPRLVTYRVNPTVPIPAEASAIHGSTDADVCALPTFAERLLAIVELVEGADLCGFGIERFDLPMLLAELRRIDPRYFTGPQPGLRRLDVMAMLHDLVPYARHLRRTLSYALGRFCDVDHPGAHGSAADCCATAAVLDAMIAHYALPSDFDALCLRWGHCPENAS